jgi:ELWxxDGT repeat protein
MRVAQKSLKQKRVRRTAATIEPMERRVLLSASLVRDIGKDSSDPIVDGVANGWAYLSTYPSLFGKSEVSDPELWRTDGTVAGTVKLTSDEQRSRRQAPLAMQGRTVIPVTDGNTCAILIDDGTPGGVSTLWKSQVENRQVSAAVVRGRLFFSTGSFGENADQPDFWTSDGTPQNTVRLRSAMPMGSNFVLYACGDRLVYGAGSEIYTVNQATGALTRIVRFSDLISPVTVIGGKLYFVVSTRNSDFEVWRTNGTRSGTFRVGNVGKSSWSIIALHGSTYIQSVTYATQPADRAFTMWKVKESGSGAAPTLELTLDSSSSHLSGVAGVAQLGESLLFSAYDSKHQRHIYRADLTTRKTIKLGDLADSPAVAQAFVTTASAAFFAGYSPKQGVELWMTDGTQEGTRLVKDLYHGAGSSAPTAMLRLGNRILFQAGDPDHGRELWISDGTASGTRLLRDIEDGTSTTPFIDQIQSFHGKTYFVANDDSNGNELWVTDGTRSGTQILADAYPGPSPILSQSERGGATDPTPSKLVEINGKLVFVAGLTHDFWVTDGTPAGTHMLKKLGVYSNSDYFTRAGRYLYYYDVTNKLYRTDGTAAGTSIVELPQVDEMLAPVAIGDKLIFSGHTKALGWELWESTDNLRTAQLIRDIHRGPTDSIELSQSEPTTKAVYFGVSFGSQGSELWKSDGTSAGTVKVKSFPSEPSAPTLFTAVGDTCFFRVGDALWRTDGTAKGTFQLADRDSHEPVTSRGVGVAFNGRFYFLRERNGLWTSDGTSTGTFRVAALPDEYDGYFWYLRAIDGRIYFEDVISDYYGSQTYVGYVSDGTAAGTKMLLTDPSDTHSTAPAVAMDGSVFFTGSDSEHGAELWRAPAE